MQLDSFPLSFFSLTPSPGISMQNKLTARADNCQIQNERKEIDRIASAKRTYAAQVLVGWK